MTHPLSPILILILSIGYLMLVYGLLLLASYSVSRRRITK